MNILTVQYKNEYTEDEIIFIPLHPGDVFPSKDGADVGVYGYKSV